MTVIKLGGSLLASGYLGHCLEKIEYLYQGSRVVLVPGGGMFAEQVRIAQGKWQFDDVAAHRMAILAMQQMSLLINALKPQFAIVNTKVVHDLTAKELPFIAIWSPDMDELDQAGIPNSWDITSDSLSAWLSGQLYADELIVVKSVTINNDWSVQELARRQVVDPGFYRTIRQTSCKLTVINAEKFLSYCKNA